LPIPFFSSDYFAGWTEWMELGEAVMVMKDKLQGNGDE
jgi:hypothetical protein